MIFGATPRAVEQVLVGGTRIVDGGVHGQYEAARRLYLQALSQGLND